MDNVQEQTRLALPGAIAKIERHFFQRIAPIVEDSLFENPLPLCVLQMNWQGAMVQGERSAAA
jgi:hypothetical protein